MNAHRRLCIWAVDKMKTSQKGQKECRHRIIVTLLPGFKLELSQNTRLGRGRCRRASKEKDVDHMISRSSPTRRDNLK